MKRRPARPYPTMPPAYRGGGNYGVCARAQCGDCDASPRGSHARFVAFCPAASVSMFLSTAGDVGKNRVTGYMQWANSTWQKSSVARATFLVRRVHVPGPFASAERPRPASSSVDPCPAVFPLSDASSPRRVELPAVDLLLQTFLSLATPIAKNHDLASRLLTFIPLAAIDAEDSSKPFPPHLRPPLPRRRADASRLHPLRLLRRPRHRPPAHGKPAFLRPRKDNCHVCASEYPLAIRVYAPASCPGVAKAFRRHPAVDRRRLAAVHGWHAPLARKSVPHTLRGLSHRGGGKRGRYCDARGEYYQPRRSRHVSPTAALAGTTART